MPTFLTKPDIQDGFEAGSFAPSDWEIIRQSNRQQVGDLDLPIPIPIRLYEPEKRKLEHVLKATRRLVNKQVGIIYSVFERDQFPDDPRFYQYISQATNKRYLTYDNIPSSNYGGGGVGLSREESLIAAIGEAVERYASGIYTKDSMVLTTYDDLAAAGIAATPPEDYARFFPDVYEQSPGVYKTYFDHAAPGWWEWGQSLVTGRPIMVPAMFVHVPFSFNGDAPKLLNGRNAFWDYSVSTGMASHSSLPEALLRGIYETVERDAIMLTWLDNLPATGLHLEGATDPELVEILKNIPFGRENWYVVDITLDIGITTCFAVYISPDGRKPYSTVGAASDLNPQKAAARALKELVLGFYAMVDYCAGPLPQTEHKDLLAGDYAKCKDLHEHFYLYAGRDLRDEMAFIAHRPARWVNIEDLPDRTTGTVLGDLETAVAAVAKVGLDVIALDLTTPDIAATGFHLGRVVIPGAQPLDPNHNHLHLDSRRLREMPRRLGLRDRDMEVADYNKLPHPFP
jgi:ribosomal protein S12 methylthiotransferase accessory factor